MKGKERIPQENSREVNSAAGGGGVATEDKNHGSSEL